MASMVEALRRAMPATRSRGRRRAQTSWRAWRKDCLFSKKKYLYAHPDAPGFRESDPRVAASALDQTAVIHLTASPSHRRQASLTISHLGRACHTPST